MKTNEQESKTVRIGAKVKTLPDGCIGTVIDLYDGHGGTKAVVYYGGGVKSSPMSLNNIEILEENE